MIIQGYEHSFVKKSRLPYYTKFTLHVYFALENNLVIKLMQI